MFCQYFQSCVKVPTGSVLQVIALRGCRVFSWRAVPLAGISRHSRISQIQIKGLDQWKVTSRIWHQKSNIIGSVGDPCLTFKLRVAEDVILVFIVVKILKNVLLVQHTVKKAFFIVFTLENSCYRKQVTLPQLLGLRDCIEIMLAPFKRINCSERALFQHSYLGCTGKQLPSTTPFMHSLIAFN